MPLQGHKSVEAEVRRRNVIRLPMKYATVLLAMLVYFERSVSVGCLLLFLVHPSSRIHCIVLYFHCIILHILKYFTVVIGAFAARMSSFTGGDVIYLNNKTMSV